MILLAIWDSSVPQRAVRSAGLGWALLNLVPVKECLGLNTYITAARRHAGGVAATKLAKAVMAAKIRVDGCMVSRCYFKNQMRGCRFEETMDWKRIVFE